MLTFGDPQLLLDVTIQLLGLQINLVWWENVSNTPFQAIARFREEVAKARITIPSTDLT